MTSLFDEQGRRIPKQLVAAVHQETRRRFVCNQPEVDHAAIHARIGKHLNVATAISVADFEARSRALLDGLRRDPRTANVAAGVGVPFFFANPFEGDYGRLLETVYLPALGAAFHEKHAKYAFVNHCKAGLEGKVGIAAGSRHERILTATKSQVVVGYYFTSLLEYSVPAAIEQLVDLPMSFSLAGGVDTCAAFIGSPDLLLRTDGYPPLLWLAGLTAEEADVGYQLEAYGYNLTFNRRRHFGNVAEYWASGLVAVDGPT